jgi:hypothetical protein
MGNQNLPMGMWWTSVGISIWGRGIADCGVAAGTRNLKLYVIFGTSQRHGTLSSRGMQHMYITLCDYDVVVFKGFH